MKDMWPDFENVLFGVEVLRSAGSMNTRKVSAAGSGRPRPVKTTSCEPPLLAKTTVCVHTNTSGGANVTVAATLLEKRSGGESPLGHSAKSAARGAVALRSQMAPPLFELVLPAKTVPCAVRRHTTLSRATDAAKILLRPTDNYIKIATTGATAGQNRHKRSWINAFTNCHLGFRIYNVGDRNHEDTKARRRGTNSEWRVANSELKES